MEAPFSATGLAPGLRPTVHPNDHQGLVGPTRWVDGVDGCKPSKMTLVWSKLAFFPATLIREFFGFSRRLIL